MDEQTYSKNPPTEKVPTRRSHSEHNRDLQRKGNPNLQKERQKEQTLIHDSKQVNTYSKTPSEMCKVGTTVRKDPKETTNEQIDRQAETDQSVGPKVDSSKKSQQNQRTSSAYTQTQNRKLSTDFVISVEEDVDENDETDNLFYSQYVKRMEHQPLSETDHTKEANVSFGEQISHSPMSQFPPLPSKS